MYNAATEEENEGQGRSMFGSRFGRWFNNLTGRTADEDPYEVEEPEAEPVPQPSLRTAYSTTGYNSRMNGGSRASRQDTIRLSSVREGSIAVMPVTSFQDIQKAADRLKAGEPQIINLEKTPAEVAERLIDFLNGVTYALDGFVEKIADKAYLFTPSHISIETVGPETPAPTHSIFDRK